MTLCPCNSNKSFDICCGPILAGAPAVTAEALMRSRYSAFVRGDLDHIDKTQAPETRPPGQSATASSKSGSKSARVQWVGLEIHERLWGAAGDDIGIVEFSAAYLEGGKRRVHRERSTFRREKGRWLYVDGQASAGSAVAAPTSAKVGRNAPCPCGSGKKFKLCCGR